MILEKNCSCMFLMGSFISRPKNMRLYVMVLSLQNFDMLKKIGLSLHTFVRISKIKLLSFKLLNANEDCLVLSQGP